MSLAEQWNIMVDLATVAAFFLGMVLLGFTIGYVIADMRDGSD